MRTGHGRATALGLAAAGKHRAVPPRRATGVASPPTRPGGQDRSRPERFTYLLGPEANRFVFGNSDLFRWRDAFDWLVPVDGPTSMLLSDGDEHRRRRGLVQPTMHHRRVAGYVDTMVDNTDQLIDTWQPGDTVDVYQGFRAAIRRTTLRTLFGTRLARDERFFGDQLQVLLDLCDALPQTVTWKRRLRTPEWRRAMLARGRIDERIHTEIAHIRAIDSDGSDVLTALVHSRDEDGATLSDLEIRDQVVTLIVAGYETTSATLAWAIYSLLSVPGVWETARQEVRQVLGRRRPAPQDLKDLTYLNGIVRETLRLYPAVVVVGRKAARDFEFGGRVVRAGSMLAISPYVTHRLPQVWHDPLRFRPQRWDSSQLGYRKPAPHEYLPFGAGPHRCVGSTMAATELTVMLARLLARTSLRLPRQRVRPVSMISMRPRNGLWVQVEDRTAD
ncbi:cytochrome P450 [Saccharomonospora marina]|uniref:cytochrome P450 n=1 Tax=Saccharomonospora marina TaxID=632569 RepID=UPI002FC3BE3C